jgi:hypothetical protein
MDATAVFIATLVMTLGQLHVWAFSPQVQTRGYVLARHPNSVVLQYSSLTGEEINTRLQSQLAKLREKDRASKSLSKEVRHLKYAWRSVMSCKS